MGNFIQEVGNMILETVKELKYGKIKICILGIGKRIGDKDWVCMNGIMEMCMKGFGKIIRPLGLVEWCFLMRILDINLWIL